MASSPVQSCIRPEERSDRAELVGSMRDYLILVDDLGGVLERGGDVFSGQVRIAGEDPVDRITAGHHTQNVADHDARAANHRFASADGWINFDAICRFHSACSVIHYDSFETVASASRASFALRYRAAASIAIIFSITGPRPPGRRSPCDPRTGNLPCAWLSRMPVSAISFSAVNRPM